jgi:chemosensory pili system protein ChpA (sensor histidine kinase/response regulator)
VQQVKEAYQLNTLVPARTADIEPLKPVLRAMRDALSAAKEAWNKFCAGAAVSLPQFHDNAVALASKGGGIDQHHLARCGSGIAEVAQWLRKDPLKQNDAAAMEIATALLLAENALESYEQLGTDFPQQVEIVIGRLAALMRGEALADLSVPHLDEMSRRAQERLMMSQVAREVLANLAQVEQALDAFFRDTSRRDELSALSGPLKQIEGALVMLGQDTGSFSIARKRSAHSFLCRPERPARAAGFRGGGAQPVRPRLLRRGPAARPRRLGRNPQPVQPKVTPAEEDDAETGGSLGRGELEQQKREAQTLAEALREKPQGRGRREDLKQHLETIRQDASLVADTSAGRRGQGSAGGPGQCAGGNRRTRRAGHGARGAGGADGGGCPFGGNLRLAEAPSEEIDAELLAIFLEEAHEVLGTIGEHLELSRGEPHNHEYLTTIRRGFHTLKGSGRMVGLSDLGETAWAIEQVMNKWLQSEQDATPSLYQLVEAGAYPVLGLGGPAGSRRRHAQGCRGTGGLGRAGQGGRGHYGRGACASALG